MQVNSGAFDGQKNKVTVGRQKVVNAIPMDVIWDESWGTLKASRTSYLDAEQIREQLRAVSVLILVADIGSDLVRLSGAAAYDFWKREARSRVVAPDGAASGFRLEDYPGGYCYLASTWAGPDLGGPVILFEKYH